MHPKNTPSSGLLVSVILVNYNGAKDLFDGLSSLKKQTYKNYEIILVDNDSTDDSVEIVRTHFPEVKVIETGRNAGFGAGNNIGIRHSQGEYIVFTNFDVEFDPGWLLSMVNTAEQDDSIGIVAPKILLFDQRDRVNTCGLTFHYTGQAFSRGFNQSAREFTQQEELGSASGCAFLIKRSVVNTVGSFDEAYHHLSGRFFHSSLEDVDLSWRVQLAGYKVVLDPQAVIYHKYIQKPLSPLRYYYLECGRYYTLLKNYEILTLVILTFPIFFSEILGWAYILLKGRKFVAEKARSYYWILTNYSQISVARKKTKDLRIVKDSTILKRFQATTSIRHLNIPKPLKQLVMAVANFIFQVFYSLTLTLLRIFKH